MAFETSEDNSHQHQRPVRVPTLKGDVYNAAVEMVEDLDGWEVVSKDESALKVTCRRPGGLLKGTATITVWVEGPDGIPSSTVHVRSVTEGGLLGRDKANVIEFVRPFHRRVC